MKFDSAYFDAGVNRRNTDSSKWDGMVAEHGDPDMVPMWIADMDFPSPPAVEEALAGVLAQRTWGYTLDAAKNAQALCAYWQRRHGVTIPMEAVVPSPCVVTGLKVCVRTLTKEGEGVLINTPVYGPFYASIRENGRRIVESPLVVGEDGRYSMNLADMEGKLAAHEATAVMMCAPHNPLGRTWSQEEMAAVVALCRRYGAALICDEIHADFVFAPNRHHSVMSVPGAEDVAVMLCAASKTFNVAGLQQSAIICPNAENRETIRREMSACGIITGNTFALAATRAAYTECDEWLDGLREYLAGSRDMVMAYAKEHWPKIRITPLDATYLMWLNCRALGLTQEELMARIFDANVKLNDGLFFGEMGRGFLRMNIGCPRPQIMKALERLTKAFA